MNRLRIRWNDGKRSVCSATLAAVLVLLAGGANALANTVWSVSKASSNTSCSLPSTTTCNTIGAAVSAASPGDVIVVGAGYYNESVDIQTFNLTILGAQAGRDARVDRHNPTKESIVDATNQTTPGYGAAFYVDASNVVIDGFTIQGGTTGTAASGVWIDYYSIQILNNIIQNNAVGVYVYQTYDVLVEQNLFKTNNKGTAGSLDSDITGLAGFGIAVAGTLDGIAISENEFTGNLATAMYFYSATGGAVTENTSRNDASFAVFNNCGYTIFSHNQGQDFGAKQPLPVIGNTPADAAIDVLYSNLDLQINDNVLEEGKTLGYNGIAFSTIIAPATTPPFVCDYCQVSGNTVSRFAGNGIVAEPTAVMTATLDYSVISRNYVEDNENDGILIGLASNNEFNSLLDNKAEGNHVFDCADDTTGSPTTLIGTLATADTWINNSGSLNYPTGLCTSLGIPHDLR